MLDVLGNVSVLEMETENRVKRRMYRNLAIEALHGILAGTTSLDDYDYAVAEYSDALKEIEATKKQHLALVGE